MKRHVGNAKKPHKMTNLVKILGIGLPFIIASFIAGTFAVSLNLIELSLLRRSWRKLTHFELILFCLALSDLLSGCGSIAIGCISTFAYSTNSNNLTLVMSVMYFMIIPVSSSTMFVIIIGMERLLAIKRPLKHRAWRSSRSKTFKLIIYSWSIELFIVITFIVCFLLIYKSPSITPFGSRTVALILGSFITAGAVLILSLYIVILYLILKRNSIFLKYDATDTSSRKKIKDAIKKEKATVIVCALVVTSYLLCNVPFAISIFQAKKSTWREILVYLNAVCNPLIYFFKGYVEKCYAKKKVLFHSAGNGGVVKNKKATNSQQSDGSTSSHKHGTDMNKIEPLTDHQNNGLTCIENKATAKL